MSTTVETTDLEAQSTDLSRRLDALRIENVREVAPAVLTRSLEGASVLGRLADDFLREVDISCDPVREAAHKTWKAAVKQQSDLRAPAELLKKNAGSLGWSCDQELKRRQAEAERLAREERERLQREADARAEAERQAAQKLAEDERIEAAAALEASGDGQAAAQLIAQPVTVAPVLAAPVFVPSPAQIHTKVEGGPIYGETWGDYEITDPKLIPREYLVVDDKKIRGVIRAMKGATTIPGIKVSDPRPKSTFRRTP